MAVYKILFSSCALAANAVGLEMSDKLLGMCAEAGFQPEMLEMQAQAQGKKVDEAFINQVKKQYDAAKKTGSGNSNGTTKTPPGSKKKDAPADDLSGVESIDESTAGLLQTALQDAGANFGSSDDVRQAERKLAKYLAKKGLSSTGPNPEQLAKQVEHKFSFEVCRHCAFINQTF